MTADKPITDLLAAPLTPDWTVEALAEQLLTILAKQRPANLQEFVLDADATTDRQSRRLLRPLLACLATKYAATDGTPPNLYGGRLAFKRLDPEGRPVWILGEFENKPGAVRVVFRRSALPPQSSEPGTDQSAPASRPGPQQTSMSKPAKELTAVARPDRSVLTEKRRRAEVWAAEHVRGATALSQFPMAGLGPWSQIFPSLAVAVTMCYEIGRIYREDWSHADAEQLAHTLSIPDNIASSRVGAVAGYLAFIPGLGSVLGSVLAGAFRNHSLLSAAQIIIKHFESDR